ncbi:MAG: AAA family ATPase [Actinobacteria bacterium]|nr:AAA family ATPase [Actinomycetota bacterium]
MSVVQLHRHGQPGYFSLADAPQQPGVSEIAISTGWWELDQIWRLYPGQFNVVTGIAGHGKSTFLLNVLCNLFKKHGTKSFLYVPENEAHLRDKLRLIWGAADGFDEFCRSGCFVQSAVPSSYDDKPQTLEWVLNKAVAALDQDEVDVVLIDPWNELEHAKPRDLMMTDYIRDCLMYLKQFCRATNATVIMVAHPTKAGTSDGKVPGLADIEGSMNWYNKCDNGLIVARDLEKPVARVISAKAREIGSGKRGVAWFHVDHETGVFTPQHGAVTS